MLLPKSNRLTLQHSFYLGKHLSTICTNQILTILTGFILYIIGLFVFTLTACSQAQVSLGLLPSSQAIHSSLSPLTSLRFTLMGRQTFKPRSFACTHGTSSICKRGFTSLSGLTRHVNSAHAPPPEFQDRFPTPPYDEDVDMDAVQDPPLPLPANIIYHAVLDGQSLSVNLQKKLLTV